MANATPQTVFLGQRRPLLRLAQAWLRGGSEQTAGLVRDYRRFFAALLLELPDAAVLAALAAPCGDTLRSWIEAEFPELPPDERDRETLAALRARLAGDGPKLGAHVAMAGFLHAFAWVPQPDLQTLAPGATAMLMRYWLRTPRLFREPQDPARFHRYLLDMLARVDAAGADCGDAVQAHALIEAALGPLDIQMAFHDEANLRPLLSLRGQLIERALDLAGPPRALERRAMPVQSRRLRVGFVVRNMEPRTESFIVLAHAERLDPRRFETMLYTQRPPEGAFSAAIKQRFTRIVVLDPEPARAVEQVRDETLDIAVLGNIACFDGRGLARVAACRLAPTQVALAAVQPSTSGFASVDAFVSSAATEPEDAQAHYTERLVPIEGAFNVFSYAGADRRPPPGSRRKALDIPARATLLLGGASMPKLQPGLTRAWMRVLAGVPGAILALYPFNPNWWPSYPHAALRARLAAEAAEAGVDPARIRLLPAMSMGELIGLAGEADLFLDSFPYSGNASLMEPLVAGCPVVALAGRSQRALQGAATLRALGLDALVAPDVDAYVALACRLASDTTERQATAKRVVAAMRHAPFFDTPAFGARFGALLARLHDQAATGMAPTAARASA